MATATPRPMSPGLFIQHMSHPEDRLTISFRPDVNRRRSEQAQLFAHLGTQVTVVGRLAPHAEPELAAVLRQVFDDDGISDRTADGDRRVEREGVAVATTSGRRVTPTRC